jgi:outer membrane protein assembly complex protein YaeT
MRARSAISRSLAVFLLAVATWARGADDPNAAPPQPPEPPAQVVRSIDWEGVKALATSDLQERIFTPERPFWKFWSDLPPFDEATLEGDMQRIAATYREYSHYRARASYELHWDPAGHEVAIVIRVEEGPAVHLDSFAIDLSEMPNGAARWKPILVDPLPLKKGDPFTVAVYGGAKRALLQNLANYGFPDAQITGGGEVDLATNTATISWAVQPGPRVLIGEVRIHGEHTVSDEVVRRELTFKPGDVYSEKEIQDSQRLVSDLGVFRTAIISQVKDDPNAPEPEGPPPGKVTRPIDVSLEERPLRNVRLGLGYGTEDKLRAQIGWLHRNVTGRADSFDVHARYSSLATEFQATLREPHIPDPRTTFYLDSRIRDDTLPAYDDTSLLTRASIERSLRKGWSGYVGYDLEFTDVRKVASGIQSQEEAYRLGYVDFGVRRITVDSLVDPTLGTWLEASVELSSHYLASVKDYGRWTLDGRAFYPIGPVVVAGRVLLGTIDAFGNTTDAALPVTKLFYAGGSATVRGYDFQKLGTDGRLGSAVGGQSLLNVSAEVRFPIWQELRGATFVDAAQLSDSAWLWQPQDLHYAVGFGLRYSTPLGPVRVDIAAPIHRPEGTDPVRIWFAIGQPF